MDIDELLLEILESDECKKAHCKRAAIKKRMFWFIDYESGKFEWSDFFISFNKYIKSIIEKSNLNLKDLASYVRETDNTNLFKFIADDFLNPEKENFIDNLSLAIEIYIMDNFLMTIPSPEEIIGNEIFVYETNKYKLTKVNGAIFRQDGLIFDGKAYLYNPYTIKAPIDPADNIPGFAKIINEECGQCDVLYRLDECLSMPIEMYKDYTGACFAKARGPQLDFKKYYFRDEKIISVHYNPETFNKLIVVVKSKIENGQPFWHIFVETIPKPNENRFCITTFIHGQYYPDRNEFTHIDYMKNIYDYEIYKEKYNDVKDGLPIDEYVECDDYHYKIWCVEHGHFSIETWYKLVIISLEEEYQDLFNELIDKKMMGNI